MCHTSVGWYPDKSRANPSQSDLVTKYADQGLDALTMSPEAFAKLIADDTVRYAKVVKESGARVD